jgi:putative phosphoesterase
MRIGLLSDTHGWVHPSLHKFFDGCDEIWHAGDIGGYDTAGILEGIATLRAVHGNIDDASLRRSYPADLRFTVEGVDVWMTHIGGYPGRYSPRVAQGLKDNPPDIFICGHSHIAKVMHDPLLKLLFINPGAAGYHGFHHIMTAVRFIILDGEISGLELIELGERGRAKADMTD